MQSAGGRKDSFILPEKAGMSQTVFYMPSLRVRVRIVEPDRSYFAGGEGVLQGECISVIEEHIRKMGLLGVPAASGQPVCPTVHSYYKRFRMMASYPHSKLSLPASYF
jgi:hypothetical protein